MSQLDTFAQALNQGRHLRQSGRRGRYAPSPTGPLHLGNARTALVAWLQARLAGGTFVMRMEDLDQPRVRPGSDQEILRDLAWMGLDWDEGPDCGGPCQSYVQAERLHLYQAGLQNLRDNGQVFPCFCSRKDVAEAAGAPHGLVGAIPYPGTCRNLSADDARPEQVLKQGRKPSLRYRVPARVVVFDDQVAGTLSQNLQREVGDFVLQRADGLFAYQWAVVIDDALMGITDVVRGMDLLDSTPRQIELFECLGITPPRFWHIPLFLDDQGRRMAKRDGSASIRAFREKGGTAAQLIGLLAKSMGLIDEEKAIPAKELLAQMRADRFLEQLRAAALKA